MATIAPSQAARSVMPKGVPTGQSYVQHRERMGIERAQRNAVERERRKIAEFWRAVFDVLENKLQGRDMIV